MMNGNNWNMMNGNNWNRNMYGNNWNMNGNNRFHWNRPQQSNRFQYGKRSADADAEADAYYRPYSNWNMNNNWMSYNNMNNNRMSYGMYGNNMNNNMNNNMYNNMYNNMNYMNRPYNQYSSSSYDF